MEVYLDNAATTRCLESVVKIMEQVMLEDYGNPSSMHRKGMIGENHIKSTREVLAKNLKVLEKEIFFTSGGTEADNLAIVGVALANQRAGKHLITTKTEHPAVREAMHYLETQGFDVTYLGVDKFGLISLQELENALKVDTILVSIMHTNNETGALLPIAEAGKLIKSKCPGALFHVDGVQGFGKAVIYPKKMNVDLFSMSGHKIHGPKGSGFLYIQEKVKIKPITYGGGQEKGLRSGTENVPAIAGLGQAVKECYKDFDRDIEHLYFLKKSFVEGLGKISGISINGLTGRDSAPHIVSTSIEGIRSEVMLHSLEEKGIYVSAGSACASNKPAISETLKAMGVEKKLLESTIRFSFSVFTTMEEISYTLQVMEDIIPHLRKYSRH